MKHEILNALQAHGTTLAAIGAVPQIRIRRGRKTRSAVARLEVMDRMVAEKIDGLLASLAEHDPKGI